MSAEKASCAIIYKTVSSRSESNQSAYRLIPAQQLQIFEHANLEQFGLAECFCLLAILIGDQLCLGRRASVGDKDGAGGLPTGGAGASRARDPSRSAESSTEGCT